jgi:hypothetical protein
MLDYARYRAIEILKITRQVILVTGGLTGLQVGEYPCESIELTLYLLLPGTCDHLFNLETNSKVTLLSAAWELRGEAQVLPPDTCEPKLELTREPEAKWYRLVRVDPLQIQVRRQAGWGALETIDLRRK